jgi:hypothetical protein
MAAVADSKSTSILQLKQLIIQHSREGLFSSFVNNIEMSIFKRVLSLDMNLIVDMISNCDVKFNVQLLSSFWSQNCIMRVSCDVNNKSIHDILKAQNNENRECSIHGRALVKSSAWVSYIAFLHQSTDCKFVDYYYCKLEIMN